MSCVSDEPELSTAAKVGRDTSSATAGVLVGMSIGGPVGAVAGAVVGAGAPHVVNIITRFLDERRNRVLQPTLRALGDEGTADALTTDPSLVPLVLQAADAAARSEWDTHVDALALALRDGVLGTTPRDESRQLIEALGTITPDGVVLLQHLLDDSPDHDSHFVDITMAERFGWTRSRARAALRRLEDGGAVETVGGLMGGGEGWKAIALGRVVRDYLQAAGVRAES